jgi:protoporphyrinogen oxidase
MSTPQPVTILGTGMAGCGAAHQLRAEGVPSILFDQADTPGGHTRTFALPGGFLFDDGPHISFTRDTRLQELLAANVGGRFETIQAHVNNYWRGHWIKHPAPCNLHGLPVDLVVNVLRDFIAARQTPPRTHANYEEWLHDAYGRTFAETFPMEYGLKYHTTTAANMTTSWLGPRLYRPELEEVLRGALVAETPEVHYVSHFRYPTEGGFIAYLHPFHAAADLRLNHRVTRVDPVRRELHFAHGAVHRWTGRLISSVPLPDLVPMIDGAPEDVRAAAARLACTTCVIVNVGLARADVSPAHWTYFYDRDICFTRLSFPHLLSPRTVPPGCGAIQAELYFSDKYRPLDRAPEAWIEPTLRDLRRCGLLREDDRILVQEARLIRRANVIFDHDREPALARVHAWLEEQGILPCGRYGEWGYQWTDESFFSGEAAARRILGEAGGKG